VIAHIAGVPVEELLLPLLSGGGLLGLAVRWLRIRLDRNSSCAPGHGRGAADEEPEISRGLVDVSGAGRSIT
jgi:hypothetical protein